MPPTKLSRLIAMIKAQDWSGALSLANSFYDLGAEARAIQTAHNARLRSDFYRQLGKDPAALIEEGKAALLRRYSKHLQPQPKGPTK